MSHLTKTMVSTLKYCDLVTSSNVILRIRLKDDEVALDEAILLGNTDFSSVFRLVAQVHSIQSKDVTNSSPATIAIAVKRLRIDSRECFKAERAAFAHIKAHDLGRYNLTELLTDPLTTPKSIYFFLSLADGDMESSMQISEFFNYKDSIQAQIGPLAEGLATLHETGIAHCDLKHKNLLIFKSSDHDLTVKIADFGHSFPISPDITPKKDHFCKGTFSAPETWREETDIALEPVDVWALGCIYMEMVAFIQTGSAGLNLLRGIRMSCVPSVSAPQNTFHETRSLKVPLQTWLKDLHNDLDYKEISVCIQSMVQSEQQDRPTAREVFECTWN